MREFIIRDWKTFDPSADASASLEEENLMTQAGAEKKERNAGLVSVEIISEEGSQVVKELPAKANDRIKTLPPLQPIKTVDRQPEIREPSGQAETEKQPERKRGQRSFIISYNGNFVGYFEADREITPRAAFLRIAQELSAADESFQPEKLFLYKPVLLRGACPTKGLSVVRGKLAGFSWQKSVVGKAEEK